MQLPVALLAGIEAALNAWVKLDSTAVSKLSVLEGKVIGIHVTGLEISLYFLPGKQDIAVMGHYPEDGYLDVLMKGAPLSLARLGTSSNSGAVLLDSDIQIEGDSRVAEQFSVILTAVDIDWEELLSRAVGDIIAHQAGQLTRSTAGWLRESAESMQMNLGEYLSEESRLTPAEAEIGYFLDQVDEVRLAVDRLEARIRNMQQTANPLNHLIEDPTNKPMSTEDTGTNKNSRTDAATGVKNTPGSSPDNHKNNELLR